MDWDKSWKSEEQLNAGYAMKVESTVLSDCIGYGVREEVKKPKETPRFLDGIKQGENLRLLRWESQQVV